MIDYIRQLLTFTVLDIREVLPYLKIGLLTCIAAVFFMALLLHRSKKESYNKIIWLSVLAGYIVIVIFITFWSREPGSRDGIDLQLFSTLGLSVRGDAFVLENVLLFVPVGVLLPLVDQRWQSVLCCLLAGAGMSLFIEVVQLVTKRGFFQVDDIITNTLGTVIGYVIYKIFKSLRNIFTG